jgi:hypothetical protein
MPTPKQGYRLADGTKVPSVTTILSRFKESGGLMKWAYTTGREHGRLEALGQDAPDSLYDVSGKAADIGTAAHAMVEAHIKGGNPRACVSLLSLNAEDAAKATNAFNTYLDWAAMSKLEIIEQEMALVSEQYRFAGTPDAIGLINGQLCLVDWKTSNAVYADYLVQIAAYRQLWEENYPERPLVGGFHLCRFSKDYGDFAHHYFRELDNAWQMFMHLRAAYEFDKELRKRAA